MHGDFMTASRWLYVCVRVHLPAIVRTTERSTQHATHTRTDERACVSVWTRHIARTFFFSTRRVLFALHESDMPPFPWRAFIVCDVCDVFTNIGRETQADLTHRDACRERPICRIELFTMTTDEHLVQLLLFTHSADLTFYLFEFYRIGSESVEMIFWSNEFDRIRRNWHRTHQTLFWNFMCYSWFMYGRWCDR